MKIKRKINSLDFSFPDTTVASLSLQNIFWFACFFSVGCFPLQQPQEALGDLNVITAVPCSDKLTHLWLLSANPALHMF